MTRPSKPAETPKPLPLQAQKAIAQAAILGGLVFESRHWTYANVRHPDYPATCEHYEPGAEGLAQTLERLVRNVLEHSLEEQVSTASGRWRVYVDGLDGVSIDLQLADFEHPEAVSGGLG